MRLVGTKHQIGCITGTALGDACGFPVEMRTPETAEHYGREELSPWFQGGALPLPFSRQGNEYVFGQTSDDTAFSLALHQTLGRDGGWSISAWGRTLVDLPERLGVVGMGKGTLQALANLKQGTPPRFSGLPAPRSSNGSVMRTVIVGAHFSNPWRAAEVAVEQSLPTHRDYRCLDACALLGMMSSLMCAGAHPEEAWAATETNLCDVWSPETKDFARAFNAVRKATPEQARDLFVAMTPSIAQGPWKGISAYSLATTFWALWCFQRHPHAIADAILTCLKGGGDADTTCAITGALAGVYAPGFPSAYLKPVFLSLGLKDIETISSA
jgi:ADP-ribosylglycohydrolase